MATMEDQVEVLVVGAGPVGLCAAYNLTRHGVRVRVVDRAPGPATTSRALATHARSLETYDQMGVLDAMLAAGRKVEHFSVHQGGRCLVRFDTDYSRLPTRFPFTLMIDQAITERVLRDALAGLGVPVQWGVTLESFTQDDAGVRTTLRYADGRTGTVPSGWLLGCDGGRSTVRKQLGLPLIGDSTETWLIADAIVDTDLPGDSIHLLHAGAGSVMLVPFPEEGKFRLLDTVDTDHADAADEVARRFAGKISRVLGRPVEVRTPSWVSVFTIQQRMVPSMRVDRVLVAGDAAHVHSPASGQGLNTGVQDAYNLAWKLAMVVRGTAGAGLLDSYGAERVPIGAALLGSTRKATVLVALRNRAMAVALPVGTGLLNGLRPLKRFVERRIMGAMSALALTYRDTPLNRPTGRRVGRVPLGGRVSVVDATGAAAPGWAALLAELREPRWRLLVVPDRPVDPAPGAVARAHPDLAVRTVTDEPGTPVAGGPTPLADPGGRLRADLGLRPGDWYLVRPDGYLASAGTGLVPAEVDRLLDSLLCRTTGARPQPDHTALENA
ncbi:FAD-dependent oxidoreductase [Micromonospora auratinigra]|uniref:2-polyprenyl-6-methoxyphenol hydroxylase n=1 Tax=Micromonospora auratinigra TaxID=261654 RepID=A0A1A8ZGA4_9ACTN|nr:FAD-dependent oxidoreductase [Micromonospora auratinigra]SBT42897.1 2-polyprenyl-6-methoxyphenol hydroxylase [Micromonospora auratinigra]